jgi:hypothetical protein
MQNKIRTTFAALLVLQALHAIEEYWFRFYDVFPPAKALGTLIPGSSQIGFVLFNALLLLIGLATFRYSFGGEPRRLHVLLWLGVAIETYNGLAHLAWMILIAGYNPGLVSAVPLVIVAGWLAYLLRRPTVAIVTPAAVTKSETR